MKRLLKYSHNEVCYLVSELEVAEGENLLVRVWSHHESPGETTPISLNVFHA